MILKVGVAGKYFIVDGHSCQCGQYDYMFTPDNKLLIWNSTGNNRNSAYSADLTNVLDGDNGNAPFANQTAILNWINTNLFFLASGGGGGSVSWSSITGKPSTFAPSAHTHAASDIVSGVLNSARLANGTATDGYTIKMVGGEPTWVNAGSGGSGWSLTGNSGTTAGTNFIGTTDAQDFVIKANATEYARIYAGGSIAMGNTAIASGNNSVALGYGANSTGIYATALGLFAQTTAQGATAIGNQATANHAHSFVLAQKGSGATKYQSNRNDGMLLGAYAGIDFQVTSGTNELQILGNKKIYLNLNTYSTNADAIAGGLTPGMLYKMTNGQVMIVY